MAFQGHNGRLFVENLPSEHASGRFARGKTFSEASQKADSLHKGLNGEGRVRFPERALLSPVCPGWSI